MMIIWGGGGYVHGSELELLDGTTRVWGNVAHMVWPKQARSVHVCLPSSLGMGVNKKSFQI